MIETSALINDIESDYKKLSNECKKKYNTIKEVIEITIKTIEKLKETCNSNDKEKINNELLLANDILFKPITLIIDGKNIKLYSNAILILKKLITYNLFIINDSNYLIKILKEIFDNSNEDSQLKILETLQYIISSNKIKYNEENINNIMIISCKIFEFKNNEYKNPIKLIIKIFIKSIFDPFILENALTILNIIIDLIDGKKKEWISPSIYSKGLGLELMSCLIETYPNKFIEEKELNKIIKEDISTLIAKIYQITNDFLIGIKISRLSLLIFKKLNMNYELIDNLIKFAERDNVLSWQKIIGLEGISEIFNDYKLVFLLFKNYKNIYENLLNCLTDIAYKNIIMKNTGNMNDNNGNSSGQITSKNSFKRAESQMKFFSGKLIENDTIICEGELNYNIPQNSKHIYKLMVECYNNLKLSTINLLEENGIKINYDTVNKDRNIKFNEQQNIIREFVKFKYVTIKGTLIGLLLNSNDDNTIQTFLNIFQNYISIYCVLDLASERDEYLNDLCKLAIPNNIENSFEIKEKYIMITTTLFNIAHCVNLLDYNSWVLLIETIQNLYYVLINSGNYIVKVSDEFNIDVIMNNIELNIKKYSYDTPIDEIHEIIKNSENKKFLEFSPNNKEEKLKKSLLNVPNKQLTKEEKEKIEILSNIVDNLFIDSNSYDNKTLLDITKAFKESSKKLINNYLKIGNKKLENISTLNNNNENKIDELNNNPLTILTYLNFNLVKILEIGVINVDRIDIIWDNIIEIFNIITINSRDNEMHHQLTKFTIDILTFIIIWILLKYKIKENNENESFSKLNWQNTIFKPILNLLTHHHNISFLLNDLNRILEKSGIHLNNNGWTSFLNILNQIISSLKVDDIQTENVFKIIEHIFNEYSSYLTIFNIDSMINVLEKFSLNNENNNICYSAIALFWQCADIVENFQKGKINLTSSQKEVYEDYLPNKKEQDEFFSKEWKNIFIKLININNDVRFDIRKSGINVFAQFYVAKINAMNSLYVLIDGKMTNVSVEIINEIFFEILKKNIKLYITNYSNNSNNLSEWEQTVIISLQALGKIVKAYIEENNLNNNKEINNNEYNKENENNDKKLIYLQLINLCSDILKFSNPEISINILKISNEIEQSDFKLFLENIKQVWIIFNELANYINKENEFIKKYSTSIIGSKLITTIIESLKQIYIRKDNNLMDDENNYNLLFDYLPKLLKPASFTEGNIIKSNPQKLLRVEKQIFDFIKNLIENNNNKKFLNLIFDFLIKFIKFDNENIHFEAYCKESFELIILLFNNYHNNEKFINENTIKLIKVISPIILSRNDSRTVSNIIKFNKSGEDFNYLWNFIMDEFINKIITKILFTLKDDKTWEELLNFFTNIFKQSEIGYKNIDKLYLEELNKSSQEIEMSIINCIVKVLLPNSQNIKSDLQPKLLLLLDMGANLEYKDSSLSISKMCLDNLFDFCKYKTDEEIKKDYEKYNDINIKDNNNENIEKNNLENYIKMRIKISKMCTPILIKRSKDTMKKFIEDEIKSGAMPLSRNRLEEVKFILEGLKNLEIFPNFQDIEENHNNNKENENEIIKVISNNKKAHLFLLHDIFGDFITTKENDIKILIKQIFKLISNEMGLGK